MSTTPKPIADLQLSGFEIHTRASYFAKFGKAAPPADPGRRAKAWIGNGTFFFLEGMALKQETIPASENLPNLEGAGPFPAYVLRASGAYTTVKGERSGAYNPLYLSLQADAQALMAQLGGSNLLDEGANPQNPLDYDPTEQRREWEFAMPNGVRVNVGAMLFIRNMAGVGSPGHWDTAHPQPVWVSDQPKLDPSLAPWGPPCRALAPNESIGPSGLFGQATLFVDDGAPDSSGSTASGGSFTQGDRNQLASIAQDVSTVLQLVQQLATK